MVLPMRDVLWRVIGGSVQMCGVHVWCAHECGVQMCGVLRNVLFLDPQLLSQEVVIYVYIYICVLAPTELSNIQMPPHICTPLHTHTHTHTHTKTHAHTNLSHTLTTCPMCTHAHTHTHTHIHTHMHALTFLVAQTLNAVFIQD